MEGLDCHSLRDFSSVWEKASTGCAPEIAYLRSKTKKGTPRTPICCASYVSFLTASIKVPSSTFFSYSSALRPALSAMSLSTSISSIFFPSVQQLFDEILLACRFCEVSQYMCFKRICDHGFIKIKA